MRDAAAAAEGSATSWARARARCPSARNTADRAEGVITYSVGANSSASPPPRLRQRRTAPQQLGPSDVGHPECPAARRPIVRSTAATAVRHPSTWRPPEVRRWHQDQLGKTDRTRASVSTTCTRITAPAHLSSFVGFRPPGRDCGARARRHGPGGRGRHREQHQRVRGVIRRGGGVEPLVAGWAGRAPGRTSLAGHVDSVPAWKEHGAGRAKGHRDAESHPLTCEHVETR
jgi:hypothetical protein